jgi:aspartyl-tRNA(Asn)/glutamyl-tRNA(Gln) amidotransferase subunit C
MVAFAMAARLTRAEVDAIATLANLALDASEAELFARQLGDILAYVEQLKAVDTTGVPPTAHAGGDVAPERADQVRPSLDPADALANAPDRARRAALFKVPRAIG